MLEFVLGAAVVLLVVVAVRVVRNKSIAVPSNVVDERLRKYAGGS